MQDLKFDPDPELAENRRRIDREETDLPGRVILNARCSYACRIHNTSPDGALIELCERHYVPPRFHLEFSTTGARIACRRAWYEQRKIGAQFLSPKLSGKF